MTNRSSALRILFVLTAPLHPNSGGVQMSTCKLGVCFASKGHLVSVFSYSREGHCPPSQVSLHWASHDGGSSNSDNHLQLIGLLQSFRPDVVINQMPYEHNIGQVLKNNQDYLLLGCLRNTLFSVKGNIRTYVKRKAPFFPESLSSSKAVQQAFLLLHRKRHQSDLKRILSTYDRFVMFGPPNIKELSWFLTHFAIEKIALIPNSIPEVMDFVPKKKKRMLWLGRVAHEQKQSELILPIWKRVSKALADWDLDVVGEGPLLESLKVDARKAGLDRIHFYGRQVPDNYYRRAAIFFMTSAFEGFPNTLVEAQSFGAIPVIFDSYPVASWLVEDGRNGFLIPPFSIEAMAERMIDLARSADREDLAASALESARRFHIDQVGEMWQGLFDAELQKHILSKPSVHRTI